MMTWAESRPVRTFPAESQQQPQLRMRENRVCVCVKAYNYKLKTSSINARLSSAMNIGLAS